MTKPDTQMQILLATIEAIEKNGIQNVTTRVIADEAGVNNAALHYYFRTKEHLIDAALNQTLNHMLEDTYEMVRAETTAEKRLRSIFLYLVDGILRFPNLIRAHLNTALMEGNSDAPIIKLWTVWLDTVSESLDEGQSPERRARVRLAVHSALSSILIAGLMPASPDITSRKQLEDGVFRQQLVEYLISNILRA